VHSKGQKEISGRERRLLALNSIRERGGGAPRKAQKGYEAKRFRRVSQKVKSQNKGEAILGNIIYQGRGSRQGRTANLERAAVEARKQNLETGEEKEWVSGRLS